MSKKLLSIIIPVYNEENTILKILNKVKFCEIENVNLQIIVINDGSSDSTLNILEANKFLHISLGYPIGTVIPFD